MGTCVISPYGGLIDQVKSKEKSFQGKLVSALSALASENPSTKKKREINKSKASRSLIVGSQIFDTQGNEF
jgi:hypothetical protein